MYGQFACSLARAYFYIAKWDFGHAWTHSYDALTSKSHNCASCRIICVEAQITIFKLEDIIHMELIYWTKYTLVYLT